MKVAQLTKYNKNSIKLELTDAAIPEVNSNDIYSSRGKSS